MKRILYILPLVLLLHSCKNAFKDALVIDIHSISFEKTDTIFFGSNQDIIVNGLPDSTISISYSENDSSFTWKLDKPAYFKLNNTTQNAISLDSIVSIKVGENQYSIKDIKPITEQFFKKKKSNSYIKLSNLITSFSRNISPETDKVNSLIAYNEKSQITSLVILDTNVVVVKPNRTQQSFKTNGSIKSRELKVEFFRTFNSVLLDTSQKSKLFHIGDTAFFSTVKSHYTPFGANEITIMANEKLDVSFDRHFREVIPIFAIDSALRRNDSNSIDIKQKAHSNTYSNHLYTINISNRNAVALGSVDASLKFAQNKNNSLLNGENLSSFKIDNWTFVNSILPLIFVFLFGLVVVYLVTEKNDIYEIESNQGESSKWRMHFSVLFISLFMLSVCRIFIGYNLSFTAPYFSFAFPTSIIVSPLLLLTVLYVWLIFILHNDQEAIGLKYRVSLVIVPIILWCVLRYIVIDKHFPYYIQEFHRTFAWNPFRMADNEVHFQTIFTLVTFIVAICLSILIVSRAKTIFIVSCFMLFTPLIFQKSSYSVTALLLLLAVITIIAIIRPQYITIKEESDFCVRLKSWTWLVFPSVIIFVIVAQIWKHDGGYFINIIFFPLILSLIIFWLYKYYSNADRGINREKTKWDRIKSGVMISIIAMALFGYSYVTSQNYNPLESGRMGSRFTSFFDFNTVHEYGIRESEKQAQFFAQLSKYSYPTQFNSYEPIHPGICSFIDPVVKNDLSVPFGLINQFGEKWWFPVLALILIWIIIFYSVLRTAITPTANSSNHRYFTQYAVIRIYCACMLVGSGLWLIASYYNIVPFTGRLIFGLGQDSIAEVFETIFLFSYMGLISKTKE